MLSLRTYPYDYTKINTIIEVYNNCLRYFYKSITLFYR